MPVVVTLRDGEKVKFEDATGYQVGADDETSLDILHSDGRARASFHPNAWQFVVVGEAGSVNFGPFEAVVSNGVTYNIQAGNTEDAFAAAKELEKRRGKR